MSDGWQAIDRPEGHASWVHYDLGVELSVQPVGGERFEVALLRRSGAMIQEGPPDVYVTIVRGMKAAAEKAHWIKENVEQLLAGETTEESEREVLTE